MGPVWNLFKAALGLAVDVSRNMVIAYGEFLKKLAKWSIIVAFILLPLPIIGSLRHISWMNGLYLAVIGLIITIWLIAAFPIVMLMQHAYEEVKSIKKTAQLIGGVLFWILLLSIYFYLVPVWNYPAAIPLVFIICAILALGFMRFGIGINPKLAVGVVLVIFFLITISFYMPTSRSAANIFVGWFDKKIAEIITSPSRPTPIIPKRIDYDLMSMEKIVFFDLTTGEPKVWYFKGGDGRYELFDNPGYHPHYPEKLKPVTRDIVIQIKKQLKEEMAKRAQENNAQERENFLNRYLLNRSFTNRHESHEVAVLTIDEGNKVSHDITQKFASLLKAKGFNVTASLFTIQFISDGIFEKIFNRDTGEAKKLELIKHADYIILGKKKVTFTENPDMQSMITARAVVEIHIISAKTGVIEDSFSISEVGAGFSKSTSEGLATKRIIKKLSERSWDIGRKGMT